MQQTVEQKPVRSYLVLLEGRNEPFRIRADVMCEGDSVTFKREGHVVGTVSAKIAAWWIDEELSGSLMA